MTQDAFFICTECGNDVLAISHNWREKARYEEVGYVKGDGRYAFDEKLETNREEDEHEWIAYCGGCHRGITVEWLDEGRIRLLLGEEDGD